MSWPLETSKVTYSFRLSYRDTFITSPRFSPFKSIPTLDLYLFHLKFSLLLPFLSQSYFICTLSKMSCQPEKTWSCSQSAALQVWGRIGDRISVGEQLSVLRGFPLKRASQPRLQQHCSAPSMFTVISSSTLWYHRELAWRHQRKRLRENSMRPLETAKIETVSETLKSLKKVYFIQLCKSWVNKGHFLGFIISILKYLKYYGELTGKLNRESL